MTSLDGFMSLCVDSQHVLISPLSHRIQTFLFSPLLPVVWQNIVWASSSGIIFSKMSKWGIKLSTYKFHWRSESEYNNPRWNYFDCGSLQVEPWNTYSLNQIFTTGNSGVREQHIIDKFKVLLNSLQRFGWVLGYPSSFLASNPNHIFLSAN